jgi:hypothetical protein
MKIGVSGASGHLGRAVVSELLQRPDGHEVVAITRTLRPAARSRHNRKLLGRTRFNLRLQLFSVLPQSGNSTRFRPSGIGNWRQRGNSGRIAASGSRYG